MNGQLPSGGLRERKKQRTHELLIGAATALFSEQGYDAVTVDEIVAAADVSPRTFYRYFASKEDLVLGDLDDAIATFTAAFDARPGDEPVLQSVRAAVLGFAADFEHAHTTKQLASSLIATTPALRLREGERQAFFEEALTPLIAARIAVDSATDMRPRLIAACAVTAMRIASNTWLTTGSAGTLTPTVEEAFTLLTEGFGALANEYVPR